MTTKLGMLPRELKNLNRWVKFFIWATVIGGMLTIIHGLHARYDPGAARHYGRVAHVHIGGRDFAVPAEYIRGPLPTEANAKQLYIWLTLPNYEPYKGDFIEDKNPVPIGYRHVIVMIKTQSSPLIYNIATPSVVLVIFKSPKTLAANFTAFVKRKYINKGHRILRPHYYTIFIMSLVKIESSALSSGVPLTISNITLMFTAILCVNTSSKISDFYTSWAIAKRISPSGLKSKPVFMTSSTVFWSNTSQGSSSGTPRQHS